MVSERKFMQSSERRQAIIVLDFGSQYSRLITRRVRECHVYSELVPATTTLAQLQQNPHLDIRGFILSGGPSSVYGEQAPSCDPAILQSGLPILGICYGMQLLAQQLGGHVAYASGKREYGPATIEILASSAIEEALEQIRQRVGLERVICGLSGGVDSAVAALLVHKAIGNQLTCVFVDTGCLRAGEREQVVDTFSRHLHIPLVVVDAGQRFLARLAGVIDPEQKRKIIGEEFIRVFEEEALRLAEQGEPIAFLAQGTLYPDVIESTSHDTASTATRIKTHHNVGGLPAEMSLKLVEPLRMLFKDEVREIGVALGLPEDWVWRHPFPGPGLAIRIIGAVDEAQLETLRAADTIVIEEIRRAGIYRELGQAFAVLTPLQSVGVMGDGRTYANVVAIRAVTTGDFMTADWARLSPDLLARISHRIVNEVPGVNRVVYDITSKPPATIEWE